VASASLRRALIGKRSFVGHRPDVPGYADKLVENDREVLKLRPVQEIECD
jgi:lipopolysaccharide/colanic/teichoic acid biosynthesis glycosyltransferase